MKRDEAFFKQDFKSRVIQIILVIPSGSVTTYGTISTLAGIPRAARQVGYILHSSTQKYNLPWQRVVNKDGYISIRGDDINAKNIQKQLLEDEKIEVGLDYVVDLEKYGWWG